MKELKALGISLVTSLCVLLCAPVSAAQLTGTDLLNLLVDNDLISEESAKALVTEVRQRTAQPTENDGISGQDLLNLLLAEKLISEEVYQQMLDKVEKRAEAIAQEQTLEEDPSLSKPIQVPYIPDYVRQQMHESLKFSVESDVVEKVKEETIRTARVFGWGIKEAPSWVHKVKISGDGRLRYQGDFFPSDNADQGLPDVSGINEDGAEGDNFVNVQDDRHRLRTRFRLMFKAKPFERIEWGLRLTTGNQGDPVSSNQTLGNFGAKWDTNFDLGYIKHNALSKDYTLIGGRFKNPFLNHNLVFDSDMAFEGVAGTYYFFRDDSIYGEDIQWDPFITAGFFPIQEIHTFYSDDGSNLRDIVAENNGDDKFLYALQVGTDYNFYDTSQLSFGLAYFHFDRISANRNPVGQGAGSQVSDDTLSEFYQIGNSLYNINDDSNPNGVRLGLASSYQLVNGTIRYRMADFYPTYVTLHAEFVKNIGFDRSEVESLVGREVDDRDMGYQVGIQIGTQKIRYLRDWQLSLIYKHLEGDAVLDAFADSDFLLGGTDAKGYVLQADYGIMDNTIVSLKWLSADSIDTPPADENFNISVDTLQLDLSARF